MSVFRRAVDGVDRGVDVILHVCLAVALGRLDADEGEVESTDLLCAREGGGLERDHLLRQVGELGRHGRERRQPIDLGGQVFEFGAQVGDVRRQIVEGGGDRRQLFLQIVMVTHGHATRLS